MHFWERLRQRSFSNVPNNHYQIFIDNFQFVTRSILDFKDGLKKYKLAMNQFCHLIIAEIRKHRAEAILSLSLKIKRSSHKLLQSAVSRKSVDYRSYMQSVTNQDRCDSCFVHTVSAMIEGAYALKKNILFHLSRQMLIDCG
ncbi:unnamed protein product [Rotaria sp. Silwood2]|nr:unnamed protein product [Rotaria sp. Silwood2]CAF4399345.1 unnamed protein product [Rotaria sp. Silwood2]